MSGKISYYRAWVRLAGGGFSAAFFAIACGGDFGTSDCKESRTCAEVPQGGEGDAPPGPVAAGEGGASSSGREGGGEGGEILATGPKSECAAAVDCSNGDGRDGEEVCVNGACRPGDAPPRVVSVTPSGNSKDVEPNAPIVVELSEALAPDTVTPDSVQLLDGDSPVPGQLSYEAGVITFVADVPLTLRASYRLRVSAQVTDEAGVALAEPYSSTFSVRDGSWHVVDIPGKLSFLSPTAPLTAKGSLLLAWLGDGTLTCPFSAGWLELGAATVTPASPTRFLQPVTNCNAPWAAANADGVGLVSWTADGPSYTQQFRATGWQSAPNQATPSSQSYLTGLTVSPLGIATRFERAIRVGGLIAQHTDASGVWQTARDEVAPLAISASSELSLAYDREGNGLVAFAARDAKDDRMQMMTSRYTATAGKWAPVEPIPGGESEPSELYTNRGGPAVEIAPTGEAMMVWPEGPYPGRLMSSYFRPQEGWAPAELVSGAVKVSETQRNRATITYDGEQFVTAWFGALSGGTTSAFTAKYERSKGWSAPETHDPKRSLPLLEYPQIGSDSHGNLLLVWRTSDGASHPLVQRRFVGGAWGVIEPLPGDAMQSSTQTIVSLATNRSGVAAIAWPVEDAKRMLVAIHVARFY